MSEFWPYSDEQMQNLPLPNQKQAWEKMELLLDKNTRKRRVFFWWPFALIALLLIPPSVIFWQSQRSTKKGEKDLNPTSRSATSSKPQGKREMVTRPQDVDARVEAPTSQIVFNTTTVERRRDMKTKRLRVPEKTKSHSTILTSPVAPIDQHKDTPVKDQAEKELTQLADAKSYVLPELTRDIVVEKDQFDSTKKPVEKAQNAIEEIKATDTTKKKALKKPLFILSAGVGLQAAIAVDGQSSNSFNYRGKNNSLSDHLPVVYFTLQKHKWFAQLEFQYASPQPVKPFGFSQTSSYAASNNVKTEVLEINKLYYHQIPLTINYHILPAWSFGAGGSYQVLQGAVAEREVTMNNQLTGTQTVNRFVEPINGYKDSFLYKTTSALLLQSQFHLQRLSIGVRYSSHLQPFIKYTKPDGTISKEKNSYLQAMLHFRLWKR